mgnify:CR=1 FL=1
MQNESLIYSLFLELITHFGILSQKISALFYNGIRKTIPIFIVVN